MTITMYGAAWCKACKEAREWLRARGVSFRELDVDLGGNLYSLSQAYANAGVPSGSDVVLPTFVLTGVERVPVVIRGFNPSKLGQLIPQGAGGMAAWSWVVVGASLLVALAIAITGGRRG